MRQEVEDAGSLAVNQSQRVSQIRLQIEGMEADLHKNFGYNVQLEQLIDQFNDPSQPITVPFQFYYDLYREQEKEVAKLCLKVQQA